MMVNENLTSNCIRALCFIVSSYAVSNSCAMHCLGESNVLQKDPCLMSEYAVSTAHAEGSSNDQTIDCLSQLKSVTDPSEEGAWYDRHSVVRISNSNDCSEDESGKSEHFSQHIPDDLSIDFVLRDTLSTEGKAEGHSNLNTPNTQNSDCMNLSEQVANIAKSPVEHGNSNTTKYKNIEERCEVKSINNDGVEIKEQVKRFAIPTIWDINTKTPCKAPLMFKRFSRLSEAMMNPEEDNELKMMKKMAKEAREVGAVLSRGNSPYSPNAHDVDKQTPFGGLPNQSTNPSTLKKSSTWEFSSSD